MHLQEWSEPAVLPLRERGSGAPAAAKAVFEAAWECSMPLTKHGVRGELAIDIAVQDFGVLTVPITACKVYAAGDASAAHGELSACGPALPGGGAWSACCPLCAGGRSSPVARVFVLPARPARVSHMYRPAAALHQLRVRAQRAHGRGEAVVVLVQVGSMAAWTSVSCGVLPCNKAPPEDTPSTHVTGASRQQSCRQHTCPRVHGGDTA